MIYTTQRIVQGYLTIYQFYFESSQFAIIHSKNMQLQELDYFLNPAVPQTKKKKEFESHSNPLLSKKMNQTNCRARQEHAR